MSESKPPRNFFTWPVKVVRHVIQPASRSDSRTLQQYEAISDLEASACQKNRAEEVVNIEDTQHRSAGLLAGRSGHNPRENDASVHKCDRWVCSATILILLCSGVVVFIARKFFPGAVRTLQENGRVAYSGICDRKYLVLVVLAVLFALVCLLLVVVHKARSMGNRATSDQHICCLKETCFCFKDISVNMKTFMETAQARLGLTILLISILFSCGFPSADFTTDILYVLPLLWHRKLFESFEIQLIAIIGSVILAYWRFLKKQQAWVKLDFFPIWFRIILITGGALFFPLAPMLVMCQALYAYYFANRALLDECNDAVRDLVSGELLEALASLVLQTTALISQGLAVQWSLLVGICSAVKATLEFDKAETFLAGFIMKSATSGFVEIPTVTGPLESMMSAPLAVSCLAIFRLCELVSGICSLVAIHIIAYESFVLYFCTRKFSIAGPCYYVIQLIWWSCFLGSGQTISKASLPLAPFCLSVPVLDADTRLFRVYLVKAPIQMVLLVLCGCERLGLALLPAASHAVLLIGSLAAAVMWGVLMVLRTMPQTLDMKIIETRACKAKEFAKSGAIVLNPGVVFSHANWEHPMANRILVELLKCYTGLLLRTPTSSRWRMEWQEPAFDISDQTVDYDTEWPGYDALAFQMGFMLPSFLSLRRVSISLPSGVQDEDLVRSSRCLIHLTHWSLDLAANNSISDKGLISSAQFLGQLTHWCLNLQSNFSIEDKGLETSAMSFPNLTHWILNLQSNSSITDQGLQNAATSFPHLTHWSLNLSNNSCITDAGLRSTAKSLPKLTHWNLNLRGNPKITDEGLEGGAQHFPQLTHWLLNLRSNSNIKDQGLENGAKNFPQLTHWSLNLWSNSFITDNGLKNSATNFPKLTQWSLSLADNRKISDQGLASTSKSFPTLNRLSLHLWASTITDEGLMNSAKSFPQLTHFDLKESNSKITDSGLEGSSKNFPKLTHWSIDLWNKSGITSQGLESSAKNFPCLTHWTLNLRTNPSITDQGLESIAKHFPYLMYWSLSLRSNSKITDQGLLESANRFPHLTHWALNLDSNPCISDQGLISSASCFPKLTNWSLNLQANSRITDQGLKDSVENFLELRCWSLNLNYNFQITDHGLESSAGCVPHLTHWDLDLKDNSITDQGLAKASNSILTADPMMVMSVRR